MPTLSVELSEVLQHNWLSTKAIPELVVNMIAPKQLGQALRRSFIFCDMDP